MGPFAQIRATWPQLIQLAASIRSGQVSAAHAVATLATTSHQSALAAALAEIGCIERSIFTLEWMLEPDLRHRVDATDARPRRHGVSPTR